MLCPMKSNKSGCDREQCAWWVDGNCAIVAIATHILALLPFTEEEENYNPYREHGGHEPIDLDPPDSIRYE